MNTYGCPKCGHGRSLHIGGRRTCMVCDCQVRSWWLCQWSRLLCFVGFHPREWLTDRATCGDCGRFML